MSDKNAVNRIASAHCVRVSPTVHSVEVTRSVLLLLKKIDECPKHI